MGINYEYLERPCSLEPSVPCATPIAHGASTTAVRRSIAATKHDQGISANCQQSDVCWCLLLLKQVRQPLKTKWYCITLPTRFISRIFLLVFVIYHSWSTSAVSLISTSYFCICHWSLLCQPFSDLIKNDKSGLISATGSFRLMTAHGKPMETMYWTLTSSPLFPPNKDSWPCLILPHWKSFLRRHPSKKIASMYIHSLSASFAQMKAHLSISAGISNLCHPRLHWGQHVLTPNGSSKEWTWVKQSFAKVLDLHMAGTIRLILILNGAVNNPMTIGKMLPAWY